MRIIRLEAENIKKLKCVEITPDADVVTLTGRNEQGKSSIIDTIELVLNYGKAIKYTKEPIRRGQERGIGRVYLGDPQYDDYGNEVKCEPNLKVTRTWTANDKSYLKVENPDGSVRKAGQSVLDSIIGNLTFDPLAFSLLKEKEQLDTLLSLVEIPLDLDEWTRERQRVYDERTATNRRLKEIEARMAAIQVPSDTPDEETSAAQVLKEQQEAQAVIDSNRAMRRKASDTKAELEHQTEVRAAVEKNIEEIEHALIAAKQRLSSCDQTIADLRSTCDELEGECAVLIDPNLSVFTDRIAQVEEINRQVRMKKERVTLQTQFKEAQSQSNDLTTNLDQLDDQRSAALAAAQMPIEHLAFDDNGVTYKGIPFRQCSSEERLRVSVAMGMALNPKLRVMFIRDASLLDDTNREVMRQMARDNQYQIWMEVVGNRDSNGIVFEEGEVVANNK